MNKILIASDHGGFELKEHLKEFLAKLNYEAVDLGTYDTKSVNYPEFGHKLAKKIANKEFEKGIAICGSGIGISISINRHKGVRGALVDSVTSARLSRQHNNANVLCLGGRLIGKDLAEDIVKTFLTTEFEGGRHQTRIEMLDNFEE